MVRECQYIGKRKCIEQVWHDIYDNRKRILETKSLVPFGKEDPIQKSWQDNRWTSSMKLRWNSQIHLISLKIPLKQDIRNSKQIYLGLKIQIKEMLTLFKEIIFFETKENGIISEFVNYIQYLMKRWEFIWISSRNW